MKAAHILLFPALLALIPPTLSMRAGDESLSSPALSASDQLSASLHQLTSSPQFSGFARLLQQADLIPFIEAQLEALAEAEFAELGETERGVTLLAPTDEALLHSTSPVLLSLLTLPCNRHALRRVLLSHFLPRALTRPDWDRPQVTLSGYALPLASSDAEVLTAGNSEVLQYGAVTLPGLTVHSVSSLIIPSDVDVSESGEEGEGTRRVLRGLLAAKAPAPAPGPGSAPAMGDSQPGNGARAAVVVTQLAVALGLLAAVLVL